MMEIVRKFEMDVPVEKAFHDFVRELNNWWPKEYTWSQEGLQRISMAPYVNGLCTEIGLFGFRCDWGRVVAYRENELVRIKWQISPQRVPEPDPDKASEVELKFRSVDGCKTALEFVHEHLENHGEGAADYQKAMDSKQGWDYILNKFVEYSVSIHRRRN